MSRARLVFLGTPWVAAIVLEGLLDAGWGVDLVVTGRDKRRTRGGAPEPTPVAQVARNRGIPVSHELEDVRGRGGSGTVGVVVAYGSIVPATLLEEMTMVNVHFSLLPRWRGAAPVERAIMEGDEMTGVCIMRMEEGLDTGPVLARREVPIDDTMTSDVLLAELARVSVPLLVDVLDKGEFTGVPQVGVASYARKIAPGEGAIDWLSSTSSILRRVRAIRCSGTLDGSRVTIVSAEPVVGVDSGSSVPPGSVLPGGLVRTGDGWIRLARVVPEGRAEMDAVEWIRGLRVDAPVFT